MVNDVDGNYIVGCFDIVCEDIVIIGEIGMCFNFDMGGIGYIVSVFGFIYELKFRNVFVGLFGGVFGNIYNLLDVLLLVYIFLGGSLENF